MQTRSQATKAPRTLNSRSNELAEGNAARMAIVGDPRKARDGRKAHDVRAMIERLILPPREQVQKGCAAHDAKASSIWKTTQGGKDAAGQSKPHDRASSGGVKSLDTASGPRRKTGTATHTTWIEQF